MYASCKSGFSSASFFSSDSVLPIWPDNEIILETENYFLPSVQETREAGKLESQGQLRGRCPASGSDVPAPCLSFLIFKWDCRSIHHTGRGENGKHSGQAPVPGKRSVRAAGRLFRTFQGFCNELLCEGEEKALFKINK